jgi:hypothetical protein
MALEITPAITYLFNKSLELGRVPKDWLDAHIVPVFKKDEKIHHQITGQFHSPVSCKILEHNMRQATCLKDEVLKFQ